MSQSPSELKFACSISERIRNKNETGELAALAYGWRNKELTLEQLEEHVRAGSAWCCATLSDGHRCLDSFTGVQLVCLDIDGDMTVAEFWATAVAQKLSLIHI